MGMAANAGEEKARAEQGKQQQKAQEQPKPAGPQPGGFQARMGMAANAGEEKARAEQGKQQQKAQEQPKPKEPQRGAKPKRDVPAMLDRVVSMINNLKKPSTQKSPASKSYVERFKKAITKPNNKGNSR